MKRKRITQTVVDYEEESVNRLARMVEALNAMDQNERSAALNYLKSRFRSDWPSDLA
jgi:hypothetical protein